MLIRTKGSELTRKADMGNYVTFTRHGAGGLENPIGLVFLDTFAKSLLKVNKLRPLTLHAIAKIELGPNSKPFMVKLGIASALLSLTADLSGFGDCISKTDIISE